MFDSVTSNLIQGAVPLDGLDLEKLPQFLTEAYAKVVAVRLGAIRLVQGEKDEDWDSIIKKLRQLAETYEAYALFLPEGDGDRASCAFVAASAHHTLSQARRLMLRENGKEDDTLSLTPHAVSPEVAACLLYLIGGYQADAAETSKLFRVSEQPPMEGAILRGITALGSGEGGLINEFVDEQEPSGEAPPGDYVNQSTNVIWGQLLKVLRLTASMALGRKVEHSPLGLIDRIIETLEHLQGSVGLGEKEMLVRPTLEGPYHLALLLAQMAEGLLDTAVSRQPPPRGVEPSSWRNFIRAFARRRPFLWQNHLDAFKQGFLDFGSSSVLTFPTGAGKTTITELKIAAELLRGRKVVYLAPTRALVDQVSRELRKTLAPIGASVIRGRFLEDYGEQGGPGVFVQTPEQCLAYLSLDPEAHSEIGLVVVDECHQLSGSPLLAEGPSPRPGRRAVDAMWTLLSLLRRSANADVVLISAMVKNGHELAKWLSVVTGRPGSLIDLQWKPTRQVRGVVVFNHEEIRDLEHRVRELRLSKLTNKAPGKADMKGLDVQPIGIFCHSQVWTTGSTFADFPILPFTVPLSLNKKWRLTPNRNEVGGMMLGAIAQARMRPIVFTQQIAWTTKIADVGAEAIEAAMPAVTYTEDELALFEAAAMELGHGKYIEWPKKDRVGIHHGLLLTQERLAIESAFRREDGLHALVATPTVAQGINLPAEAVIIAGDNHWVSGEEEGGMQALSAHELLNAAGRAGRAGHYAHGIVIDFPGEVLEVQKDDENDMLTVSKLDHILSLFGVPDQCLDVVDPLTQVLDRIQQGGTDSPVAEYFLRRTAGSSVEFLQSMFANAFGNSLNDGGKEYAAKQAELLHEAGLQLDENQEDNPELDVSCWSAFASDMGVSAKVVASIASRLPQPTDVAGWSFSDLLNFVLNQLLAELFALVDPITSSMATIIPREGKRAPYKPIEYTESIDQWQERWQAAAKTALELWLSGKPIVDINEVLRTARNFDRREGSLKYGRRFALHTVSSMGYGASVIARIFEQQLGEQLPLVVRVQIPLVAGCVREGFDQPDKLLLFWCLGRTPGHFPRVKVHDVFRKVQPHLPPWNVSESLDERRRLMVTLAKIHL